MCMHVLHGPGPHLQSETLTRVHSCGDFQRTEPPPTRFASLVSPPHARSEDPSRAETPQFFGTLSPSGDSLEGIVAAVAKFFAVQGGIPKDRRTPQDHLLGEDKRDSNGSEAPQDHLLPKDETDSKGSEGPQDHLLPGYETDSNDFRIAALELFPVGETRYMPHSILSEFYQVRKCQTTRLGWEGVSPDPIYEGSVFIVSEELAPLDFSRMEPHKLLAEKEPFLDPNCRFCSQADFTGLGRRPGEREAWMKQCFQAFDKNAGLFLKTDEPQTTVSSSWLLEPEHPTPQGKRICADCEDLLGPFLNNEPLSVDYSPQVFNGDRPIYTLKVTRVFNQKKFDQYSHAICKE